MNLDFALACTVKHIPSSALLPLAFSVVGRAGYTLTWWSPSGALQRLNYPTELAFVSELATRFGPTIWDKLAADSLYGEAFSLRATFLLSDGPAALDARLQEIQGRVARIFQELARDISDAPLHRAVVVHRSQANRQTPTWHARTVVRAGTERAPMSAQFVPSPDVPNGWAISVSLPVTTTQAYTENNRRVRASLVTVAANSGITLVDVHQGAQMC